MDFVSHSRSDRGSIRENLPEGHWHKWGWSSGVWIPVPHSEVTSFWKKRRARQRVNAVQSRLAAKEGAQPAHKLQGSGSGSSSGCNVINQVRDCYLYIYKGLRPYQQ